jgi:hypothetical protein
MIAIFCCDDLSQAQKALEAVFGYLEHPEYPQHTRIGKHAGGGAMVGGISFWVWQTLTGWSVERCVESWDD